MSAACTGLFERIRQPMSPTTFASSRARALGQTWLSVSIAESKIRNRFISDTRLSGVLFCVAFRMVRSWA